nr:reverse transcriptase domain-containing protein [Tanacetum cinerariifolium]
EDQFQEDPLEDPPEVPMADNRTMAELLQHPPRFFPPSKTTNLRNEITRFQQRFDESFYEAWDRFNELIRACPHHGFSELHQLDTFYNALNVNDQDLLNSAVGGNFLDKIPRECLKIIESKSKLQLKKLSQIVSLAVALTHTKTVPLLAETSIETTFKIMCHKPPQQITTKEISVSDLRWLQIKFDLPVFLPTKIIKTVSIGGTISIRTEEVNQPLAYQAPIPQTLSVTQTDFKSYIKANDAVLRNMKSQGQGSGTLPSNTVTNPKEDLKGITTRSGVAYQGPTIPTRSKVVKQRTEVTKDQVQTPSSQSTTPIQPLVTKSETQTPVSEPVVAPVSILIPYFEA